MIPSSSDSLLYKQTGAGIPQMSGMSAVHMLNVRASGMDRDQLQKIGAADRLAAWGLTPKPDHSYLHIIDLGAGEWFGPNENADYYNEGERTFRFSEPIAEKTAELDGGLTKYHGLFTQTGGVFRRHKNSLKGGIPSGRPVWAGYNDRMHRGELLLELPSREWTDVLNKVANRESTYWSIGAGVPRDICSICGFRYSKKTPNRCEHTTRKGRLTLWKEGALSFMINDILYPHDISHVLHPADRIAVTLEKVAETENVGIQDLLEYQNVAGLWLPESSTVRSLRRLRRMGLVGKLAEAEATVGENPSAVESAKDSVTFTDRQLAEIAKALKDIPTDRLMSALSSENAMLTPKTFVKIVIRREPSPGLMREMGSILPSIFSDMQRMSVPEILEDGSYSADRCVPELSDTHRIRGLSGLLSLDPSAVQHRVITIAVTAPEKKNMEEKEAETDESIEGMARCAALEYANYQLAFLEKHPTTSHCNAVICYNRTA